MCHNLAFQGDYSPVLAKHSKNFPLEDSLSVGVDRMQRNFEPMRRQVESWRAQQQSPAAAKLTFTGRSLKGTWKSRSIWHGGSTNSTSFRSTRSLNPEPCGACRTRSRRHLKCSIRSHNSGPGRSLAAFLKRRAQRDHGSTTCPTSVGGNGLVPQGPFPRCLDTRRDDERDGRCCNVPQRMPK